MEKLIIVKKIVNDKLLSNKQLIKYNFTSSILINSIKNDIEIIISEYYFLDILKFEDLKNILFNNLFLFRIENITNQNLINICDNINNLISSIYYPVHLHISEYIFKKKNI